MTIGRSAMAVGWACLLALPCGCTGPPGLVPLVVREQRTLDIREPSQIPQAPLPKLPPPATVSQPAPGGEAKELSLDEALHIALANSKVIRTLAGTDVISSGRTIYDPAIANTAIDVAKSAFDPIITAQNAFSRGEMPSPIFDPTDPTGARLLGSRVDNYALGLGISKKLVTGATVGLNETLNVVALSRRHRAAQSSVAVRPRSERNPTASPGRRRGRQRCSDPNRPAANGTVVLPTQGQRAGFGPRRDPGVLVGGVCAHRFVGQNPASRAGSGRL